MDQPTKELFGRFPREVATPKRWVIHSQKELSDFIRYHNGITDCYVSVYPSNFLIDKIFFDNDYSNVLEQTKKMYSWLLDNDYQTIPIVSGKKGYHLYVITKPKIYGKEAKLLLTKASYSIIKSVFGPFKQEMHFEKQILRNASGIITPDPAVLGDMRRITRLQNTLRPPENRNYCTYLPPDKFLDMTEEDVIHHMKSTHTYDYHINFRKAPLLTDFEYDFEDDPSFSSWTPISSGESILTTNPSLWLKGLLRPCLYRHMVSIHPNHVVRVASTIDLLKAGYTTFEILSVYATLGWEDFEENYSIEQIESCKKYKVPYSCSKLRKYKIPNVCCVE
jgi:hypothetical protein